MNEMLKRGFLLGLGVAAYSKEKIQSYVDGLVSRGKLTPREAEEWKEELIQKGLETEEAWSQQTKERIEQTLKDLGFATEKDIQRIESRLMEIEQKLNEQQSSNE